jgi:hypothetical protein
MPGAPLVDISSLRLTWALRPWMSSLRLRGKMGISSTRGAGGCWRGCGVEDCSAATGGAGDSARAAGAVWTVGAIGWPFDRSTGGGGFGGLAAFGAL